MEKLFIVVRADLPPGLQAAQVFHAGRLLVAKAPERERVWFEESNNVAVLQVPDEASLAELLDRLRTDPKTVVAGFREPDLDGSLTAIAALGATARRCTSTLPLALRAA